MKQIKNKDNNEIMDITAFLKKSFPCFLERPKRDEVLVQAFMEQEEKLLNGNKGKHAWLYNGALWRMSVDEIKLIKSFEKDLPDEIGYCDIIGGYE